MPGDIIRFPGFDGEISTDDHAEQSREDFAKAVFFAGLKGVSTVAIEEGGVSQDTVAEWIIEAGNELQLERKSKEQ
jgi:hypothetical protein